MAFNPAMAAVVAGIPSFVGGIVNAAGSRKERIAAENMTRHIRREDRAWYETDRKSERDYAASLTRDNRQYQEGERVRDQRNLDTAARQSVDTRGVNFQKLRDEAVAAGFNPMSVMGTAGMYSTELNRQIVGTGGVSGSGGGGLGQPGGGMYGGGGGNVASFSPAISSGSFIADALERGIDTVFNTPPANDPLASALRNALATDTVVKDAASRNPRQSFGYDLTDVPAYRPKVSVGGPALSGMPTGDIEIGGRKYTPITRPDGKPGRLEASVARRLDIEPFDTVSPGDWAEIVGEIGEVESVASQPAIRRNITDDWHSGRAALGYGRAPRLSTGFDSIDNYNLPSRSGWW